MNRYKVLIAEPAARDLQDIIHYLSIELQEPAIARRTVTRIKEAVTGLDEMPSRCALLADERLAARGIRKLLVDNYIVFFIIMESQRTVAVIRILYCRRNWESLL